MPQEAGMKEILLRVKSMGMVYNITQMVQNLKENGLGTKNQMELTILLMEKKKEITKTTRKTKF